MAEVKDKPKHLVVVGSSAGGIEALGTLLAGLKPDFPAPVVLAQHLDPTRPSHLAAILERRSGLPVVEVGDTIGLEAGKAYVVPSNRHVVIRDGSVALVGDHANRPRPSVDLLLSTASISYGEGLIAVILTGLGSDGAAGAVDVKHAGGTVIIQNPETASHPSMPQALPPTVVDHVADLEALPALLHDLVTGIVVTVEEQTSVDALTPLLTLVSQRSGIDFRKYKPATIVRRIGRRMTIRQIRTLEEYRDYLESRPEEIAELVKSMLLKVTEFFRDAEAFAFLRENVIPRLIEAGRERGRVLRLWSAGCATGEEAYSLAFLVADALGPELPEWSVKVFATDLDESAIAFARRGLYPVNVLRSLPDDYLSRFFDVVDHGMRVTRVFRQMIIFGQQDLSRGVPFPRIDLVLCRNLLIYFKSELQQEVLDLFAYSLSATNGYLFLGKAETARPSQAVFEPADRKWKIYRCLSGPKQLPSRKSMAMAAVIPPDRAVGRAAAAAGGRAFTEAPELELDQIRRFNELLLRHLPIGIIVIDRTYRILSINASARRLLGIRDTATDQDFLHTVRGLPYNEVRNAIDRVFRDRGLLTMPEVQLDPSSGGEGRWVALHLYPIQFDGASECAVVSVQDATDLMQARRQSEAVQAEQRQLSDDLGTTNRRLAELNKELQDANEELQAANEEMALSHEEVQATNEEFEATNEELQATNEELETNNEELQATNEELETVNDELLARTSELQELTRVLTGERMRLADLTELAPFHVVVLRGPHLVVESVSPPSSTLFGGQPTAGRTLEEVLRPEFLPVLEGAREAFRRDRPWTSPRLMIPRESTNGATPVFVFTVIPSHDEKSRVDGVVVYAEDLSESQARDMRQRLDRLRMMIEHAHQVAVSFYDAESRRLLDASPRFLEILGRLPGGRDRTWDELGLMPRDQARALFEEVVASGHPRRLREVRVDGGQPGAESVWDCSLIPLSEEGGTRFVVVSAVEVTEPVQARAELERLDRLKDQFLSIASHELRTPLMPLSLYSEMLNRLVDEKDRGPEWENRVRETVAKFQKQIHHLSRLTDDLFDVARLQSSRFEIEREPVRLKTVLEQAREQASGRAGGPPIRLDLPEEGDGLIVLGDEQRLLQVVLNLLGNAARHGTGTPAIELSLRRHGRRARIQVRDHGPGIPPVEMPSLFSRFHRGAETREARGGLGLGLFISRGIVGEHGGSIEASPTDGGGATLTVELPLLEAPKR